jgi:adenosine deaminase
MTDLETLPLSDLHRHLDGSVRLSTLAELARRLGRPVPADLVFTQGMGLDAALGRFAYTLSLLQEAGTIRRVAAEIAEDAAADGVTTLEVRFAPQLHRGAPLEAIVDAALEGLDDRAGLVLCGLYGEPPEVLEGLVAVAAGRPGVTGIDLAGGPVPGHAFRIADYERPFRQAEEMGLGRTVHAGEGRPAAEIRTAVEVLHAERIGHGTTLLDDPAVRDLVIERDVTIEACPTSNVHVGVLAAVADHPLPRWLDAGVPACLCPDNTLLSAVTCRDEYRRALEMPGMTADRLAAVAEFGHRAAFRRR